MSRRSSSSILAQTGHRPWPLPERPWLMAQTWHNLLFAHWPVPVGLLRPLITDSLELDTFDGHAWVGVVPFHMNGVRLHGLPAIPMTSAFAELNVRTYVRMDDKPGVWFFSLDAASRLAVATARMFYFLPYFYAKMAVKLNGTAVAYQSRRMDTDGPPAEFAGQYRPAGPVFEAQPGTIEYWLAERYCLYSVDGRERLYRCDIHHLPWELQLAEAVIETNSMADGQGIELPELPPLLHYVQRQDVLIWSLTRVAARVAPQLVPA